MRVANDVAKLCLSMVCAAQLACGGDSTAPIRGVSAHVMKTAGDRQTARVSLPVSIRPTVVVKDAYGSPVAGVPVLFEVTSGGGYLNSHPADWLVTTDASGSALAPDWILGKTAGPNTLTASVDNRTVSAVFVATATPAPPCTDLTHTIGTSSSGQLTPDDCDAPYGRPYTDLYKVNIPAAGTYVFTQTGTFDPLIEVFQGDPGLTYIGQVGVYGIRTAKLKAILPAGNVVVQATSIEYATTGSYTLSSVVSSEPVTDCVGAVVVSGISTQQSLQTTDCAYPFSAPEPFKDYYAIYLKPGQSITVSMNSSEFDAALQIRDTGLRTNIPPALNDNKDATTTNAQLTYTSTRESVYVIIATSAQVSATGAYTLTID